MVNVEYIAQNVAEYIFVRLSKHVDLDLAYQRRIMEKAVTRACDLCRVCKGVTLKGGRCSRQVAGDADYCFQHRGATMASHNPQDESSASEEESSEDESSASEGESSGSEEESSEAETEEDSDEESSGSSEEEPSGSDEESTEDDASASEEESEGESSGESSDEEVPPPKKSKKSTKAKKTKKSKTTVETSPAHSPQQGGTPLVQEFQDEKDRLACAFLEAVRDVSREINRNPDIPEGDKFFYRWLTVDAISAIKHIHNTGEIMHDTVDRISNSLSNGKYELIDLDRLAQQISCNLGMGA
ncbi:hypothetical protein AB4K20DRAFT_1813025 [Rhizopus microsporus]